MKGQILRYLLIVISIGAVIGGFSLIKVGTETKEVKPLFTIIKSLDDTDRPIVAVVNKKNNEILLQLYKINPIEQFKFETIEIRNLSKYPDQIGTAKDGMGVWVKNDNLWTLYNQDLEEVDMQKRDVPIIDKGTISFEIEKMSDGKFKTIFNNKEKILSKEPVSIHKLSTKLDIWIIVFQDEFSVFY